MSKLARTMFALGLSALLLTGCGKAEDAAKEAEETAKKAEEEAAKKAEEAEEAAKKAAEEAAEEAEEAAAAMTDDDYIKVIASHEPATETDPVEISIESFEVTKAEFDPANIEGGMVELSLDLDSIKSDKDKRDGHLKSPDYLDTAQHGTATVKVSEVKKEGETYKAQAEVSAHGQTKTFPVEFEVLEQMDDGVRVKATHTFDRLEFGIGKEPDGENERVAKELRVEIQLTLKKGA